MSDTLRDQLLALGFKKTVEKKPEPRPAARPQHGSDGRPPGKGGDRHDKGRPPYGKGAPSQRNDNALRPGGVRPPQAGGNPRPAKDTRTREEIDLAKAYALRAQTEKAERERAEREAQEKARERKERKLKLAALLEGKSLNDAAADVARNFPHHEKIRRVYVTAAQLQALNCGELAVVQHLGRYMLVDRETALAAQAIMPESLALLVDPNAPVEDDVPPDLMW